MLDKTNDVCASERVKTVLRAAVKVVARFRLEPSRYLYRASPLAAPSLAFKQCIRSSGGGSLDRNQSKEKRQWQEQACLELRVMSYYEDVMKERQTHFTSRIRLRAAALHSHDHAMGSSPRLDGADARPL